MVSTFYDSLFVFKNYNILILYDNKYYCDFKFYLIFNSIDNGGDRIRYQCPNTDTLCYNTDTLCCNTDTLYTTR